MSLANDPGARPRVVIIGGGYSGAVLAWHLHHASPGDQDIVIVEPRAELGRGLAYDSRDPAHRINVPAWRMNLDFEETGEFEQWLLKTGYLARDPAAQTDGGLYPSRESFGAFVHESVASLGGAVTHIRASATDAVATANGYRIACDNGATIDADILVLAVAHTPPQAPGALAALRDRPRFVANPWAPDALASIRPDDRVLIVGTGLTMADIVASLDRRGHRGLITAISRRGLRSQPHAGAVSDPFGDFITDPERTALAVLRRVRRTIAQAQREGLSWHPVLDQLRLQGQEIWRALPPKERAQLVRRLRPFWDTYRFRIAPQIDAVITRRLKDGTLAVRAAALGTAACENDVFSVAVRPRRGHDWTTLTFDAVALATGPAHRSVFTVNPLLAHMASHGLARPDPLGLGIDVDPDGHAIGRDGRARDTLYVAGPLARGTFGELMGAADVARYARMLAHEISRKLPRRPEAGALPLLTGGESVGVRRKPGDGSNEVAHTRLRIDLSP